MDGKQVAEIVAANRAWLEVQAAAGDMEAAAILSGWELLGIERQLTARQRIEARREQVARRDGSV